MERSASALLLPLYYVKKQTRQRLFNERGLILLVIFTSLFSLFIIFWKLPNSSSSTSPLKSVFVPQLQDSNKFIHNSDINHEVMHKAKPPIAVVDNPKLEPEANQIDHYNAAVKDKRDFIKNMTLHAWNGYKLYAWGKNELKPLSKRGHQAGIFGGGSGSDLGATIVDALDTLYLMGFEKEFLEGKKWIVENLNLNINSEFSAFEVNIRFIGGLIAMHTLTKEQVFLDRAEEIAKTFLPIFDSPTGIPYSLFNPKTGSKRNYQWASGACSILAEFGTLSLEFNYLTDLTGNPIYKQKVDKIFKVLERVEENGLYFNYLNPSSGKWCNREATLGALADSFYEYLLKLWLYGNKRDDKLLAVYLKAMEAAKSKLIGRSPAGLTFAGELSSGHLMYKMGHLACFSAGMFALTAMEVDSLTESQRDSFKKLAVEITHTCHESYVKTATHLGPETFHFGITNEPAAKSENEKYYILRPEVVEAYFYLWRLTKDNKYRDWAWDAAQAIEKHCRTESGYSGIRNVYDQNPHKDDVQQSFFFAETLKYLYLIFSDDSTAPFNKYVFNTEAHPFLINKSNK